MRISSDWTLTPWRLAIHEPTHTAVAADLHLGYDLVRRKGGDAVPLADWDQVLAPMAAAATSMDIKRLVIAGDLFEKGFCPESWHEFEARVRDIAIDIVAVVPGNHDRDLVSEIGLPVRPDGFQLGGWTVRHGHESMRGPKTIMGHWHPSNRLGGASVPCYVVDADSLVLPAYSHDAAGVNVWRRAQWRGRRCLAIVGGAVVDLGLIPGPSPSRRLRKENSRPRKSRLHRY